MILLDHVVQILAGSQPYAEREDSGGFELSDRPVRGGVAIQRDHPRSSMLLRCLGKEPLSRSHITPSAQEEVDGAPLFIDGPVEVTPLAAYLDISLVHAPRVTHRPGVRLPTLFKIRHVALHPPQDRRMSQQDAPLGHPLAQVTGTEFESEVPSHTQNDDLLVKVPPLEQILCRGRFRHPGRYGCAGLFKFAPEPLSRTGS